MRIAVLSDTHGRLPDELVTAIRDADEIWHLGDVTDPSIVRRLENLARPLRVVRGNCDECADWPWALDFTLAGRRILLTHIPPKTPPAGFDLLLHGHTHVPRNEVLAGVRLLNPGCVGRANKGAPSSYAWLELEKGEPIGWEIARV